MDFVIVTHPANLRYVREAFAGFYGIPRSCTTLFGIEIRTSEDIPERCIENKWYPPASDRFVEYEDSDHEWLRSLGAGHIEQIDKGPLFYKVQKPVARILEPMCINGRQTLYRDVY